MSVVEIPDRVCGRIGCTDAAVTTIRHPKYGERAVCRGHADGQEVVADV